MTPFPPEGVATGATNPPNAGPSAPERVRAVRNDLSGSAEWGRVEALAALLEPEAFDPDQPADEGWRERTKHVAIGHAAKVITEGYVRVVDDEETVEWLAEVLAKADDWFPWDQPADVEQPVAVDEEIKDGFRGMARAAVQALLGNSQPAPSSSQAGSSEHHVCCPHCTAKTGSCVRCGVRDAKDDGQLCGECDAVLEAEFGSQALRDGRSHADQ